jgi:hypothetical protein
MADREPRAHGMTFGELATDACTIVGATLMALGLLVFILVYVLGLDGLEWVLVGIPLLVSTALIVTSLGTGYFAADELVDPDNPLLPRRDDAQGQHVPEQLVNERGAGSRAENRAGGTPHDRGTRRSPPHQDRRGSRHTAGAQ